MTDDNPFRAWRKRLGLKTQLQGAEALGVSIAKYRRLERMTPAALRESYRTELLAAGYLFEMNDAAASWPPPPRAPRPL